MHISFLLPFLTVTQKKLKQTQLKKKMKQRNVFQAKTEDDFVHATQKNVKIYR